MKGPRDWLEVMRQLASLGVQYEATWLGDGPLLEEMRVAVMASGLADRVKFGGFVGDRGLLLGAMRRADLFVFCHKTPESPRCLIETLMSAAPFVGYDSPYPADLAEELAPDLLTPPHDPIALAGRIADLDRDRSRLAELVRLSHAKGGHFSDEAVFGHRSDLIKQHLAGTCACSGCALIAQG